jgi:hypothetical protein
LTGAPIEITLSVTPKNSTSICIGDIKTFTITVLPENLPISLLRFNGICKDGALVLDWQTATETNNDYFTVEGSEDGYYYTPLLKVSGMGNSNSILNYTQTITNPYLSDIIYLHLRQTDYDGNYTISAPIAVENCSKNTTSQIRIYPNPTTGALSIEHGVWSIENVEIYDVLGRRQKAEGRRQEAEGNIELDISHLPAGVYLVRIQTEAEKVMRKVVKY